MIELGSAEEWLKADINDWLTRYKELMEEYRELLRLRHQIDVLLQNKPTLS